MAVEKTKKETEFEIDIDNVAVTIDPKNEKRVGASKDDERIKIRTNELISKEKKTMDSSTKLLITIGCGILSIALGVFLGLAICNIPTIDKVSTKYFAALSSGDANNVREVINVSSADLDMILPPDESMPSMKGIFKKIEVLQSSIEGDTAIADVNVEIENMGENQFHLDLTKDGNYLLFFPNWKVSNMTTLEMSTEDPEEDLESSE